MVWHNFISFHFLIVWKDSLSHPSRNALLRTFTVLTSSLFLTLRPSRSHLCSIVERSSDLDGQFKTLMLRGWNTMHCLVEGRLQQPALWFYHSTSLISRYLPQLQVLSLSPMTNSTPHHNTSTTKTISLNHLSVVITFTLACPHANSPIRIWKVKPRFFGASVFSYAEHVINLDDFDQNGFWILFCYLDNTYLINLLNVWLSIYLKWSSIMDINVVLFNITNYDTDSYTCIYIMLQRLMLNLIHWTNTHYMRTKCPLLQILF